ncbi:four-helix bundle copper-binding protein [Nostoc sp. FACHB-892]|nr:four-helix bundle copper-binding protein [Nostoc sp. FACHB-892]
MQNCAEACDRCASECEKHDNDHCKRCAQSCSHLAALPSIYPLKKGVAVGGGILTELY